MGIPFKHLNGLSWNADDLHKKFKGAFVLGYIDKVDEVKRVYYIDDPASDSGRMIVTSKGKESVPIYQKNFMVEDDRPPSCITNCKDDAVVFRYNPDRQWRRGVGLFNCYFYYSPMVRVAPRLVDFDLVESVFFPKHTPLNKALEEFKANPKLTGRALSNLYLLTRDGTSSPVQLYRARTLLGAFTGSKFFSLQEAGKLFSKELYDDLPELRDKYARPRSVRYSAG